MTPREHLAVVLSYLDDLESALEGAALLVDDEAAYWETVENRVGDEAMYLNRVASADVRDDEMYNPEEFTGWATAVEELITRAREGSQS